MYYFWLFELMDELRYITSQLHVRTSISTNLIGLDEIIKENKEIYTLVCHRHCSGPLLTMCRCVNDSLALSQT